MPSRVWDTPPSAGTSNKPSTRSKKDPNALFPSTNVWAPLPVKPFPGKWPMGTAIGFGFTA